MSVLIRLILGFALLVGALLLIAATPQAAPVRVAEFVADCPPSHRGADDPIVHPGEPGNSHLHEFFGNRSTDAFSTVKSLRAGTTTCRPKGDLSSYWVPVLEDADGAPIDVLRATFYYVSEHANRDELKLFPRGLRVVAGYDFGPPGGAAQWSCRGSGMPSERTIPRCPEGTPLELLLSFPDCWDGKRRDSADHHSHMDYSVGGRCPRSHPVLVPGLRYKLLYDSLGGSEVELSIGADEGTLAHGDFFDAWDRDALRTRVRDCLRVRIKCAADGKPVE
ncbi:MAG: DUF1996 domain-containing protein [Solirubrobacterales bacterium]